MTQRHTRGWRNSRKQKKLEELEKARASSSTPSAAARGRGDLVLHPPPSPASHLTPQESSADRGWRLCSRSAAVTRCEDASEPWWEEGAQPELTAARSSFGPVPPLSRDVGSRLALASSKLRKLFSPRFRAWRGLAAQAPTLSPSHILGRRTVYQA